MSEQKYYDSKTIDFITAKEAREMTNKVIEDLLKKNTLKKIQSEAKNGHNFCIETIHQNIDIEIVMSFLRELGYKVKISSFSNYNCNIKISW